MNRQRQTYRQRIFIYFFSVFTVITVAILAFQYNREKDFRAKQLENNLHNISELTHRYIEHKKILETGNYHLLDSLLFIVPQPNVRITLISREGDVLFDSTVKDYGQMENHLARPEVQKALFADTGANIRRSSTTDTDYYYYARFYKTYFVRTAIVYDLDIKEFLHTERIFVFFVLVLFALMLILLYLATSRLGDFITRLKDFAIKAGHNEVINSADIDFPDNELGIISTQIVQIYERLKKAKDEISAEREKLINHMNALNEGIAFFSPNKEKILANSHFVHFINLISEKSTISPQHTFEIAEFEPVLSFIHDNLRPENTINPKVLPQFSFTIGKNEMYYNVRSIIFADRSFEIVITDITQPEKRRLLKQQLTSNIAHELKTPLASVKGYLETIMNNEEIPAEKRNYFIERAFNQAERLHVLLNDISLLNNIEDAGELFEFKTVMIQSLVNDVLENQDARMKKKNINYTVDIGKSVTVFGNDSLLSSVFQNFVENTIKYAGENVEISIRMYHEDEQFYYFSYADSGAGIKEEHLSRIFERFYRVDQGRTREAGGTGLGLSIVRNAVSLHKGEISVRNRPNGGLEFLFSLAKR